MVPGPPCQTLLASPTPLGAWLRGLMDENAQKHRCALANKLARMVWAVLPRHSSVSPSRRRHNLDWSAADRDALIDLRCLRMVDPGAGCPWRLSRLLADAVQRLAGKHHAVLLANHGPVVAGSTLDAAANAIEELEETAKLFPLLRGSKVRLLTDEQVAALKPA
jgi:ribulose-5-phosphate 4-epimerase/fuculose-1-phosphate aldolase